MGQHLHPSRHQGLSVSELMIALAIAAVLAGVAAPGMSSLVNRQQADAAIGQLIGAVQLTRQIAISRRVTTTLCPGRGPRCGRRNTWHEGAMIFLDGNANSRRDAGEAIVQQLPPLAAGYRVYWRSFRNRKSLSMKPTGLTDWQNGNMLVCPPGDDPRRIRQLVVNAQGRVRVSRDSDGDGLVEGSDGRPVAC